jgi:hypothetical protein
MSGIARSSVHGPPARWLPLQQTAPARRVNKGVPRWRGGLVLKSLFARHLADEVEQDLARGVVGSAEKVIGGEMIASFQEA